MTNKIVLVMVLLMLLTMPICLASSPDHFNGYDNIAWGNSPDDERLVLLGYDLDASFYEPISKIHIVKVGSKNFRLKDIQYVFFNKQFSRVSITVDEISSPAVFQELISTYGQPDKVNQFPMSTRYCWIGDETIITRQGAHITIESRNLVGAQVLKEGGSTSEYP